MLLMTIMIKIQLFLSEGFFFLDIMALMKLQLNIKLPRYLSSKRHHNVSQFQTTALK